MRNFLSTNAANRKTYPVAIFYCSLHGPYTGIAVGQVLNRKGAGGT